jgi:hypothetical protein
VRLPAVENGHGLLGKLKLAVIRKMLGDRAPDIVRVIFYRPRLFGKPFSACLQHALRGPSEWSVGERELFAAFVSGKNRCPF